MDAKFDDVDQKFQHVESKIDSVSKLLEKNINWLKIILVGFVLPLVIAVLSLLLPHFGR